MKGLLTKKQINKFLKEHEAWLVNKKGTELSRSVYFKEYLDGLMLIARIAVYAEMMNHHPDITFKYGSLKIKLTTHNAKGLTELDTAFAGTIDHVVG